MLYKTSNQTRLKYVSIRQPVSVEIPLVYQFYAATLSELYIPKYILSQQVSNRSTNIYRGHLNCKIMRCQIFLEAMFA